MRYLLQHLVLLFIRWFRRREATEPEIPAPPAPTPPAPLGGWRVLNPRQNPARNN